MESFQDFQPINEEERRWVEMYNAISDSLSGQIRNLPEAQRLVFLKELSPSDLSLMNLYIRAYKKEDYETCAVAKMLLNERGFKDIPS